MKKLYIIGNGFDLHHGLKTSYLDFAKYLEDSNNNLFTTLEKYISHPLNQNSLWSDFESNLANLDIDSILSDHSIYLPSIASDEFRDRDLHVFPDTIETLFQLLTEGLFEDFEKFIQLTIMPKDSASKIVELDADSTFLTFNYTNTLEKLYKIKREKITYLHNSAFYGNRTIILGHGLDPKKNEDQLADPPDHVDLEDYDKWYCSNIDWDYSFDTGKETLQQYFSRTFKSTEKVIKENFYFFDSIKQFEEINIFGHSLSDIDMPYFIEIYKQSNENVTWKVTYHSLEEKKRILEKMIKLGVNLSKLELIELQDILIYGRQLKLF